MKKLLLIAALSFVFLASCGSSDNNKQESKKQESAAAEPTAGEKVYVKAMTYSDFIKNVWDIEANAREYNFKGNKPCVIDFYATWCGPCKKVAPVIEQLAREYEGRVDFYKVDTDQNQKLAMILQIQNIPTVFFFREGRQPEKSVGAKDEAFFRAQINKLLSE